MGNFKEFEDATASIKAFENASPDGSPPVINVAENDAGPVQEEAKTEAVPIVPEESENIVQVVDEEDSSDQVISVADILNRAGINDTAPATETPADGPDPVESASTEPADQPDGLGERVSELSADNKALKEQVALLTKRALAEPVTAPAAEAPAEEKADLNPDVQEYLDPYIREQLGGLNLKEMQEENARLKEVTAPLVAEAEVRSIASDIAEYVDGFTVAHVAELKAEIGKMPEADRAKHESYVGAVALAKDLMDRGALSGSKKKPTTSRLASRAHTEGSGSTQIPNSGLTEEQQLKKLIDLPNDQFRAMLEEMEG